jgi:hypothetical protein
MAAASLAAITWRYAEHNNSGLDLSLGVTQIRPHMVEENELVVVTARWLADGAPVYLTPAGTWSRSLQEAKTLSTADGETEAALRTKNDQRVVADPYTFRVELKGGEIDALSARERIRSTGPTTRIRRPD